jgi:hypothetical protein
VRRADPSSRGVLTSVVYVIECHQVQLSLSKPTMSRYKRPDKKKLRNEDLYFGSFMCVGTYSEQANINLYVQGECLWKSVSIVIKVRQRSWYCKQINVLSQ